MQGSENKDFIDIDEVFKSKNPGLYRWLPPFFLNYLKKVTHQQEINLFIKTNSHKQEFDFVDAIIEEFGAKVETEGLNNIPASGGCIFAANHPLGGLDAMSFIHIVSRKRKDIKFIVNDILLRIENFKGIFIGVNKHGKNSPTVYSSLDELYASGSGVLIFPAGLVSRKQHGKIMDLEWKKSFVAKARKHHINVVPVFIEGKNSSFFYNLSNFRKKIGINANVEMLYLADEMYNQKNKTIKVIFGQAIPYTIFDSSHTDQEWAQLVKQHVYSLPEGGHTINMNMTR